MTTAKITVEFVNEPKPGKKMGSIKTKELGHIWCWPNQLDIFKQGHHYDIEYTINGDFKTFKSMAAPQEQHEEKHDFPEHELLPARTKSPIPASPTDTTLQEHIFVCGIVNNWVSRENSDVTEAKLIALTNTARNVWGLTFGKKE